MDNRGEVKYRCLCCGSATLTEVPPGTFEICSVCGWEDDQVQASNPDYRGGANLVSLNEARANFLKFGRAEPAHPPLQA
jgi:Cysteine-rich CPCC